MPPEQLLQAWASHASLARIDGEHDPPPPPSGPGEDFGAPKPGRKRAKSDFRGISSAAKPHRFSVDPDALRCRKSKAHPALPSYRGHGLMDSRHALIVDCKLTQATGTSHPGGSAIDGRSTRHKGYAKSINARRGIEKVFGWIKQWGGLSQFKLRGTKKVSAVFALYVIACNLIRLGNLLRPAMAVT